MTEPRRHECSDAVALRAAVVAHVAAGLRDAVQQRGQATLAVPGGRTPEAMLKALAETGLPWSRITVFPGDDRVVAPDHAASNYGLIRRALGNTAARLLPLVQAQHLDNLEAAAAAANVGIGALPRPWDLMWLGMGTDGHIASLFPGQPHHSPDAVMAAIPQPLPPEAPFPRLSLSMDALRDSRELILVITGAEKRNILEAAMAQGSGSRHPVGVLLAGCRAPVSIFWSP